MTHYTLAVNCSLHDASIALFKDDTLVFFSPSERLTRIKHDYKFSTKSIDHIFNNFTKELDLVVIQLSRYHKELLNDNMSVDGYYILRYIKNKFKCKRVLDKEVIVHGHRATIDSSKKEQKLFFSHHCTHAISAFYMSPFDEAVCLTIDALGSGYFVRNKKTPQYGVFGVESTCILEIDKFYNRKFLYKKSQCLPVLFHQQLNADRTGSHSATLQNGLWYNDELDNDNEKAFKERFTGLSFIFDASSHTDIGNMYETITRHLKFGNRGHGKVMGLSAYGKPNDDLPPFLEKDTILSNNNLFLLGRELNYNLYPELFRDMSFQKSADIAYAVQKALEKVFLHHAEFIIKNSKIRNLVLGGGCALNILGVSAIKEKYPEFNIFIDPIATDSTHAIGLGIHYYKHFGTNSTLEKRDIFSSVYLGPEYSEETLRNSIDTFLKEN